MSFRDDIIQRLATLKTDQQACVGQLQSLDARITQLTQERNQLAANNIGMVNRIEELESLLEKLPIEEELPKGKGKGKT